MTTGVFVRDRFAHQKVTWFQVMRIVGHCDCQGDGVLDNFPFVFLARLIVPGDDDGRFRT
jgi:hypothetical protein